MMPPSFPPIYPSASTASAESVSSTHADFILQNFRHEDVIHALMTHLRERELELGKISKQRQVALTQHLETEQKNAQLQTVLDSQRRMLEEKDAEIALLRSTASQKESGSTATEEKLKTLTDELNSLTMYQKRAKAEYEETLEERDEEITELTEEVNELKEKLKEFEVTSTQEYTEKLREECKSLEASKAEAEEQISFLKLEVDQLEKKLKSKEWMIKSLQEESEDQRSRENHLVVHVRALKETIESYETQFVGKGVDVPMLLAKLKDADSRCVDLEVQMNHMRNENKKLIHWALTTKKKVQSPTSDDDCDGEPSVSPLPQHELDNQSFVSGTSNSFFAPSVDQYDQDEELSLNTNVTDVLDDPFAKPAESDADILIDLLEDVKVGFESIQSEGLCVGDYNSLCQGPKKKKNGKPRKERAKS